VGFVGNLHSFPAVKEFWNSVKNWQSYRHEFGVLLFWDTVYIHRLLWSHTSLQVTLPPKMFSKLRSQCQVPLQLHFNWSHWYNDVIDQYRCWLVNRLTAARVAVNAYRSVCKYERTSIRYYLLHLQYM